MMLISRLKDRRFCAFCKGSRRVYLKKHIDLTNVLGAMVFAVAASVVVYGSLDPRGAIFFGIGLILGEVFVHSRWRASVICRLCGFDPVIYKRSPQLAAKAVRRFYEQKVEDPEFILSKSPLLEVRRRMREQERKKQMIGQPRLPVIDQRT